MATLGMEPLQVSHSLEALPSWADAPEVAAALGVSAHTVRRLARQGRSPIVVRRVGSQWRWSRADLERFIEGVA